MKESILFIYVTKKYATLEQQRRHVELLLDDLFPMLDSGCAIVIHW